MQNIWSDNNVPELISAGYVKLSPHTIYLFSRVCHRRNTWICPYISRHLLSLNPLQARCRRYSRG
ncbi:hypothetical protein C9173_20590, partial [Escherichia coli]